MKMLFGIMCSYVTIFIAGLMVGIGIMSAPSPPTERPILIGSTMKAYPMEMTLRIMANEDFEASTPVKMLTSTQLTKGYRIAAFSETNRNPCRITIPDNFKVSMIGSQGRAKFDDPEMNETVAHEIAHCLYGAWHPPWNVINEAASK